MSPGMSQVRVGTTPLLTPTAVDDWDLVDEWGAQSFPASDPPANW